MQASQNMHVRTSIRFAVAVCLAAVALVMAANTAEAAPRKASMQALCSTSGLSGAKWEGVKPDSMSFFWAFPEEVPNLSGFARFSTRLTSYYIPTPTSEGLKPLALSVQLRHRGRLLLSQHVTCGA